LETPTPEHPCSRSHAGASLDSSIERGIAEATTRLAAAEHELTLAMEAISVPQLDADNEMVGERLRKALIELRAARLGRARAHPAPEAP
jgi:hypothetical protein